MVDKIVKNFDFIKKQRTNNEWRKRVNNVDIERFVLCFWGIMPTSRDNAEKMRSGVNLQWEYA